MYRICKSFTFEAGHQLEDAITAKCHECVHGHSYTVEVYAEDKGLDKDDMVVDFAVFKPLKKWVMDNWDHGLLLHVHKRSAYTPLIDAGVLHRERVHFYAHSPTAEFMAKWLHQVAVDLMRGQLGPDYDKCTWRIVKVRIHETATGWAEYDSRS